MGKRVGAWFVDLLLYLLLVFVFSPFGPFGNFVSIPAGISDTEACDAVRDREDVSTCIPVADRAYFVEDGVSTAGTATSVAWFVLVFVIWQGLAGATPGKTVFGVRVVNEAGQAPGVGKAFVRSILWIVDGAPWIVPLVGPITALSSKGHRRVGDMAAKTFVVAVADMGTPPQVPGLTPPYGAPAYAPGMAVQPPPGPAPAPDTPASSQGPQGSPGEQPTATMPAETQASSSGAWAAPESSPPPPPVHQPQWDAARGAYICWDPHRARWLQWDDAAQQWTPI
jgi:uncharacterized RDD family membrane protein YckC